MQKSQQKEAWLSKECPAFPLAVVEKQDSESQTLTAKILSLLMHSFPAVAHNASSNKLFCNDRSCPAPFRRPVTTFEHWTEILTDRLLLLGPEDLKCNISQMPCQCGMCTGPTPNTHVRLPVLSAASPSASSLSASEERPIWIFVSKTPHTSLKQARHVANCLPLFIWIIYSTGNLVCSCKSNSSLCVQLASNKCLIYICHVNGASPWFSSREKES